MPEPEQSQWAREVQVVKAVVLAPARFVRWFGQQFMAGVRSGIASQQEKDGAAPARPADAPAEDAGRDPS